jgi:group I intron endonuclease
MYYLVYQIKNKINNKIYIGVHKTKNINDGYMGSSKILKKTIDKYGIENFIKSIIYVASSSEEMFEKEKELVVLNDLSYNLKKGGFGGWDHIDRKSEEFKERFRKISLLGSEALTRRRYIMSEETKCKIGKAAKGNQAFLGRKHSEESKVKMSKSKKGRFCGKDNSGWGTCWITKDDDNKKIKKENLSQFLLDGWKCGRIMKKK